MQVQQIDHLNLSVASFEESAGWYGRVFGFEIVERGIYEGQPWGTLRSGDAMLCIYQHPELAIRTDDSVEASTHQRIAHWGLRVTEREAWEAIVEREQLTVKFGGAYRWPHSTSWYVVDPNGYTIEVALWDDNQIRFS